jgi:hypothetical protein
MVERVEYWQQPDRWPKDRSGAHVFLLEALRRLGEHWYGQTWRNMRGFFRRAGPQLPATPADADLATRERAHEALSYWCYDYHADISWSALVTGEGYAVPDYDNPMYQFSDEEWAKARETCDHGLTPQELQGCAPFEDVANRIIDATCAETKPLHMFTAPLDRVKCEPMAPEHWNRDWARLWPRFAFGQTDANDPSSQDPHGGHSIFVLAADLELLTKGRRNAAPTNIKKMLTSCMNDLAAMMDQQKVNTKENYYNAALKKYPTLGETQFKQCWRDALKTKPEGIRHPSWDKPGVRKSDMSRPVAFAPIAGRDLAQAKESSP